MQDFQLMIVNKFRPCLTHQDVKVNLGSSWLQDQQAACHSNLLDTLNIVGKQ